MVEFGDDLNPGLALITDWLFSSGNSSLSIDMLVSCLKRMGNHQAVDLLNDLQGIDLKNCLKISDHKNLFYYLTVLVFKSC